jgi:TolB-like protein
MQSENQPRNCVKFGIFEVDLHAGEIRKRNRKVPLQDKPFRILSVLLRNPGTVVSRDGLRREVWPEDTFVDFDNGLNTAINKIREVLGDSAENPRFVETLARRGYRFIAPVERTMEAIRSIAVLPLASYSKDPNDDFLAEGMTETLISHLCRIKSLKVISRTSAMRYKGTQLSVPEIAHQLKVDAVVEGSLQQSHGRVLITAQLIEASSDAHLWAESYEWPLEDILVLQREIAQAIARQIGDIIAPPEAGLAAGKLQVEPHVYQDYLQGRYFLNRRAPITIEKAIACFEKAVGANPEFAPAHSNLAESLMWRIIYADAFPENAYAIAKQHAQRALQLDPTLAAAHVTLGFIQQACDCHMGEASAEFERALSLEPGNADVHQFYGVHLAFMGQHQLAEDQLQQALSLDPFSLSVRADLGWRLC